MTNTTTSSNRTVNRLLTLATERLQVGSRDVTKDPYTDDEVLILALTSALNASDSQHQSIVNRLTRMQTASRNFADAARATGPRHDHRGRDLELD